MLPPCGDPGVPVFREREGPDAAELGGEHVAALRCPEDPLRRLPRRLAEGATIC